MHFERHFTNARQVLSQLAPGRSGDVSRLALSALIAGALSTLTSASIAVSDPVGANNRFPTLPPLLYRLEEHSAPPQFPSNLFPFLQVNADRKSIQGLLVTDQAAFTSPSTAT